MRFFIDHWNVWLEKSVNRRIFGALVIVGSFTLLVNVASVAKELVVASKFGTGDALDAFLIAFLLPSFAINVIGGSFNAALIPTYIKVRECKGMNAAQQLFSNTIIWSTGLLLVVSAFMALSAKYVLPIIGSGFSPEKLALTHSLFFVLLPVLMINGLSTTWAAVLNAGERFAFAAVVPIATPIVTVVLLLVMEKIWGIYSLAIGTVGGFAIQGILLGWGLKRQGISIIPRWYGMDPDMKQVIKQYVPMVAAALLMSSTGLVDQSMAAMLGAGSVSVLNYGNKVVSFILGIGSMALGTAVLPHFSRMVAVGDWSGVRHTLKTYIRLILLATVPLTLIFFYFSEPMVRFLFERGSFEAADTVLVSKTQMFYLLQVPFYSLGILIVRLLSSLRANYAIMWGAFINLLVNIILNYIFMRWLGVAGIALSTSVVYLVSFSYLFFILLHLMKDDACEQEKRSKI